MDFKVDFDGRLFHFRPVSVRARRWLERNQFPAAGLDVSFDRVAMTWRALSADEYDVKPAMTLGSEQSLDFDDQYSILLMAKANLTTGRPQEALTALVKLRGDVLHSIDPKSKTLLPEIDHGIASAHDMVRTDSAKAAIAPTSRSYVTWLHHAMPSVHHGLLDIAISIVLVIELYRFISYVL